MLPSSSVHVQAEPCAAMTPTYSASRSIAASMAGSHAREWRRSFRNQYTPSGSTTHFLTRCPRNSGKALGHSSTSSTSQARTRSLHRSGRYIARTLTRLCPWHPGLESARSRRTRILASSTGVAGRAYSHPQTPPWCEQHPRRLPPHVHDGESVPSQHFSERTEADSESSTERDLAVRLVGASGGASASSCRAGSARCVSFSPRSCC